MLNRYRMALVTLLMGLVVLPVAAAERVDALPEVKEFHSFRVEVAQTVNGQVFLVGKGEEIGQNKHYVLKTIPFGNEAQETIEVVIYAGKTYTRENNDTQWYLEDLENVTGLIYEEFAGYPVTRIGTVNVAGVPTDQYQIWIDGAGDDPEENLPFRALPPTIDHLTYDLFIGQQDKFWHQDQLSVLGSDPELGDFRLEDIIRAYDFNAANLAIGIPANAKPRSEASLFGRNRQISRYAPLLALPQVRELVIKRLSN